MTGASAHPGHALDPLGARSCSASRAWRSQFFVAPLQKKLLANVRAGLAGNWDEAEYRALSARLGALGRGRDARAAGRAVPHGDEAGVKGDGRARLPASRPLYDRAPCQDFTSPSRPPARVTSRTSAT